MSLASEKRLATTTRPVPGWNSASEAARSLAETILAVLAQAEAGGHLDETAALPGVVTANDQA
jgi:hypothetical protein